MTDELFRLVMYVFGALSALVLATRLFGLSHWLAKGFGVMAVGWSTTCVVLAFGVVFVIQGGPIPTWHYTMRTANVFLLGLTPVLLLVGFEKLNGNTGT